MMPTIAQRARGWRARVCIHRAAWCSRAHLGGHHGVACFTQRTPRHAPATRRARRETGKSKEIALTLNTIRGTRTLVYCRLATIMATKQIDVADPIVGYIRNEHEGDAWCEKLVKAYKSGYVSSCPAGRDRSAALVFRLLRV